MGVGRAAVKSAIVVGLALTAAAARADVDAEPVHFGLEAHGFASQGFLVTTGNEYLVPDSKRGSFQLSEVGLNFSKTLTDNLHFGVQFFAKNFSAAGSYLPQVDWFYLDYRAKDWLGLRFGRLKIPFGLFNEVNDIDSARVPILLPQSFYPQQARSFLFAQTGAELYGSLRASAAGALEYRLYGGTIYIDPKLVVPVGSPIQLSFNVPYTFGGRLLWETPLGGLRFGASYLRLHLDSVAFIPGAEPIDIANDSWLAAASVEYVVSIVSLTAEYGRGHTDQKSIAPGAQINTVSESAYIMASCAPAAWFQPAVYYSLGFPDVSQRKGLSNKQHDVSLTLRFDVNEHWLIKAEGHYMAGTTGLVNPLRLGPPPADPARHWGVFLLKTTAFF